MSHRRYYIRAGARTSADGLVRASSNFSTIDGLPLAREGDPVDCPACGTEGIIECVGPRLADRFEEREYALSEDLCICACTPPPTLIADQTDAFQTVGA